MTGRRLSTFPHWRCSTRWVVLASGGDVEQPPAPGRAQVLKEFLRTSLRPRAWSYCGSTITACRRESGNMAQLVGARLRETRSTKERISPNKRIQNFTQIWRGLIPAGLCRRFGVWLKAAGVRQSSVYYGSWKLKFHAANNVPYSRTGIL